MKILRILLALLAIVAIAVAGIVIERRHALAEADRETVANIDRALPAALAADAELAQRLGRFVRLEGSGYRRPKYFMQLIERIEFERAAVFERGKVDLAVMVGYGQSRNLHKRSVERIGWRLDPNQGLRLDQLKVSVVLGGDGRQGYSDSPPEEPPQEPAEQPAGRPEPVTVAAISTDCATVFLGRRNKVEIWGPASGRRIREVTGQFGEVEDLVPASGAGLVAIAGADCVRLVRSASGEFLGTYPLLSRRGSGRRVCLSDDGRVLVLPDHGRPATSALPDGYKRLADVFRLPEAGTREITVESNIPTGRASFYLTPDGSRLMATLQGEVCYWDLEKHKQIWRRAHPASGTNDLLALVTPLTGRPCVFVNSSRPCGPELWAVANGETEAKLEVPPERAWRQARVLVPSAVMMTVSHDERLLALVWKSGLGFAWDLSSGRLVRSLSHDDWELAGTLSDDPDAEWLDPEEQSPWFEGTRPHRGSRLICVGFNHACSLYGISAYRDVGWVWRADLKEAPEEEGTTNPLPPDP